MLELSGQSGETPSSLAAKAVRKDMPRHQSLSVVCMPAQCLRRAFNAWIHHTSNRVNPLERFNQLMHARLVEHMNERCLDPMVGSGRRDHKIRESMISELEAYEQAYLDSLDVARGGRLTQASRADLEMSDVPLRCIVCRQQQRLGSLCLCCGCLEFACLATCVLVCRDSWDCIVTLCHNCSNGNLSIQQATVLSVVDQDSGAPWPTLVDQKGPLSVHDCHPP